MDSKKLARQIMGTVIKHPNGESSENIAIMLASSLSRSIHNPYDGEMDEYDSWKQWVVDQLDLIEVAIASAIDRANQ